MVSSFSFAETCKALDILLVNLNDSGHEVFAVA